MIKKESIKHELCTDDMIYAMFCVNKIQSLI